MANATIEHSTITMGPSDKVVEAALELAEATRVNAKAIMAIAKALRGPGQATGVFVAGDSNHVHATMPQPWRGEGFYPPPPPVDEPAPDDTPARDDSWLED